jgi:hypothetical protein
LTTLGLLRNEHLRIYFSIIQVASAGLIFWTRLEKDVLKTRAAGWAKTRRWKASGG